jgi:hypothetical protein
MDDPTLYWVEQREGDVVFVPHGYLLPPLPSMPGCFLDHLLAMMQLYDMLAGGGIVLLIWRRVLPLHATSSTR